ncbi:MAG TPA: DUF92 domain-containing protein [Vicinamibacterales bacterium]|nr:DUF92 domain-containing protein [Vicinamibacterales bacterium]
MKHSEARRKWLHIAMAVCALPLRVLTWPQAAIMAAAAVAFNAWVLPRIAPSIVRDSDHRRARAGLLYYPLAIFVLTLVFPTRLDIVASAWGVMAFGDGFATLAGLRLRGRPLPWNPRKTWSGLLAFVVMGSIGASALAAFVAPAISPTPPWLFVIGAPIAAAVVAGLVETLAIDIDDNLSVPLVAAGVLWFLSQFTWMAPIGTVGFDLIVGAVVSLPLAFVARRVGSISTGGAITGVLFASVIYAGLFLAGLTVLGVALAVTIGASRVGARRMARAGVSREHGRRGAGNIIANCVVGTLGALLEIFSFEWGLEILAAWFVAGIAAGASDTVASEIGQAFGGTPRSFPTWTRVPAGTPGAVSILGTVAGIAGATLIAAPAAAMWLLPWEFVLPIVGACTVGAFTESTLATRLEADGILDNHALNFLNTTVSAALAVWWCSRAGVI